MTTNGTTMTNAAAASKGRHQVLAYRGWFPVTLDTTPAESMRGTGGTRWTMNDASGSCRETGSSSRELGLAAVAVRYDGVTHRSPPTRMIR
jgi:hypothetical protein